MFKTLWSKLPQNSIARFFIVCFLLGLAIYILPFVLGGLLLYFLYKKINGRKLKVSTIGLVGLLTLFFGSAWVAGFSSPSSSGTVEGTAIVATQAPSPTLVPSPSISLSPTLTQLEASATPTRILTPTKVTATLTPRVKSTSSSSDTYVNVDGNTVHSPVQSDSAPAGATAQCKDGSYSFSQHRSGTCSGHGGVARWL